MTPDATDATAAENARPRGYEDIKALKRLTRRNIPDLLAMAINNDPFYAGQPAHIAKAAWFAALWTQFAFAAGVHLRRIHYQLVSQEIPLLTFAGVPYENTEACWNDLSEASKAARYLGLVAADAFEDHRNPVAAVPVEEPGWWGQPALEWDGFFPFWSLPRIPVNLAGSITLDLPAPAVSGYSYTGAAQPYHLELWVEKSTMNDILAPLCRQHGAVLSTALGFLSITRMVEFLQRVERIHKPTRVWFISDFDPAGEGMPVAAARQLEFWVQQYAPGADIKLTPLVLTRDQAREYRLPRTPIKDTDRRKGGFEDRHGEGATELDALEALHPGELAFLVRRALEPYYDPDLSHAYYVRREEAEAAISEAWEQHTEAIQATLGVIQAEAEHLVEAYRDRLTALNAQLQEDLAPLSERLSDLYGAVDEAKETFAPHLPETPEATVDPGDETAWLFDAARPYLEQLAHYKARKDREQEAPSL